MKNFFLVPLCLMMAFDAMADRRVKRIVISGDEIARVKTAIGIATIIQVPDRPNSVVVGDQNSFKVEYLDNAITIKPLMNGAKSNLYVFSDWNRFNVELITGKQNEADYIVYLDTKGRQINSSGSKPKPPKVKWKTINQAAQFAPLSILVKRIGIAAKKVVLIEFQIKSQVKNKIDPAWFWVKQQQKAIPIESIIFEKLVVKKDRPVKGVMQILVTDLASDKNSQIELRRKSQVSTIKLPKLSVLEGK